MTTEEAIKQFERRLEGKEELLLLVAHNPCAVEHLTKRYEADEIAFEALREQEERENPKPLTLEELSKMDGEPVWLTGYNWRLCYGTTTIFGGLKMNTGHACTIDLDGYGSRIVAYRHKPKGE